MRPLTLDQRVANLERQVARLSQHILGETHPESHDWRSDEGLLSGDSVLKEVFDEGGVVRQPTRPMAK
jgi:hypothetical protein